MQKIPLLLLLFLCFSAQAQLIQDESYLDRSFWEFKVKLEACIVAEDKEGLKDCLADVVLVSKDLCEQNGCTKEVFMEYHMEENAKRTWDKLYAIVRLGFARLEDPHPNEIIPHSKTIFQAPSFKSKIDEEGEMVVLGERVNIRAKPTVKSAVVGQASYEKLKIAIGTEAAYFTGDEKMWVKVKLANGKIGYIIEQYSSAFLEKEITVAKVKGKWKIISYFTPMGC